MGLTRPRYSQIYDTDYKQSVRLATTSDVGNLLAGGNNITNSVDGKTVIANDRILVKDQTDGKQNGIYRVVTAGTGSDGTWIRAIDADASDKVTSGMTTTITDGTDNINKTFKLSTQDPIVVGTTALVFVDPFVITAAAGGANTYVQFNDINVIGGSSNFTFDKATNIVSVGGNIVAKNSTISNVVTQGVSPYISNQYVMYGTTSNSTETEIFINGQSGSRIPVANNTTVMYEINIVGRRTDAANVSASWHHKGAADNFSGYVADVGNLYEIVVASDDANLVVDTRVVSSNIGIFVTGVSSQTYRWVAVVKTTEVSQ